MSDSGPNSLRELERQWKESGANEDAVLYLRSLQKAGLSQQRISQLAVLGWEPAIIVYGGSRFILSIYGRNFFNFLFAMSAKLANLGEAYLLRELFFMHQYRHCVAHQRWFISYFDDLITSAHVCLDAPTEQSTREHESFSTRWKHDLPKCQLCLFSKNWDLINSHGKISVPVFETIAFDLWRKKTGHVHLLDVDLVAVSRIWIQLRDAALNAILPYILVID